MAIPERLGRATRVPGPTTDAGLANSNEPLSSKTLTEGGDGSGTRSSTSASA